MQPSSNKGIYILLIIILVVLLITSGANFLKLPFGTAGSGKGILNAGDSFFDNQNAMVMGKITKAEDNTITIENSKGVSQQFPTSKTLMINPMTTPGAIATPSGDLKQIELGKDYNVSFIYQNGNFEVMSIFPSFAAAGTGAPPPPPTTGAPPPPPVTGTPPNLPPPPSIRPAAAPNEDDAPPPVVTPPTTDN